MAAVALSACLTIIVSSACLQTVSELKTSSAELHYERALQLAEAGANAYLSRLTFGASASSVVPPALSFGAQAPTLAELKAGLRDGTYSVMAYPAGSNNGYCAGTVGKVGSTATIASFGVSNGIVRQVTVRTAVKQAPSDLDGETDIFPSGKYAIYGITSVNLVNNSVVDGAFGSNGSITLGNNCLVTDTNDHLVSLNGAGATLTTGRGCVYEPDTTNQKVGGEVVWPTVSQLALKVRTNGLADLMQAAYNDNSDIVRDGVAGSDATTLSLKNKGLAVFPSKSGGSNYYLTNAEFGNGASVRFDNSNGPINVWFGPVGGPGSWSGGQNLSAMVTRPDLIGTNPVHIAFATTTAITGVNNFSFDVGIYAYDLVNNVPIGSVEVKNNGAFTGSLVAASITGQNNCIFTVGNEHFHPKGNGYYRRQFWAE